MKKQEEFVKIIWVNKANQQHEAVFTRHKAERMAKQMKSMVQEIRIEEI